MTLTVLNFCRMLRSGLPLKERVLMSGSSRFSPPLSQSACKPEKLKLWSDSHMKKATDAVQTQGFSIRRASEEYAIPKSTLHDRVSGRVQAGECSGPSKYLSDEEEQELEEFLTVCASIGYARSRMQVIALEQEDGQFAK